MAKTGMAGCLARKSTYDRWAILRRRRRGRIIFTRHTGQQWQSVRVPGRRNAGKRRRNIGAQQFSETATNRIREYHQLVGLEIRAAVSGWWSLADPAMIGYRGRALLACRMNKRVGRHAGGEQRIGTVGLADFQEHRQHVLSRTSKGSETGGAPILSDWLQLGGPLCPKVVLGGGSPALVRHVPLADSGLEQLSRRIAGRTHTFGLPISWMRLCATVISECRVRSAQRIRAQASGCPAGRDDVNESRHRRARSKALMAIFRGRSGIGYN